MHLSFLKKKKKKSGMKLWQWHCRIPFHFSQFQKFFLPPISAMSLPQLPKIYTLYFGNAIAANYFFSSHFWQCHCHNCQKKKFPIIWFSLHAPGQQVWAEGIAAIPLPKIKNFSLQLLLNFGNGIAAIHSLSSDC